MDTEGKAKVYAEDGSIIESTSLLWDLQYMAAANRPVFIGRLENDWWKESKFLTKGIKKGWIEIVPDKGFLITEKGKDVLRENGLHTSKHPLDEWDKKIQPVNS